MLSIFGSRTVLIYHLYLPIVTDLSHPAIRGKTGAIGGRLPPADEIVLHFAASIYSMNSSMVRSTGKPNNLSHQGSHGFPILFVGIQLMDPIQIPG